MKRCLKWVGVIGVVTFLVGLSVQMPLRVLLGHLLSPTGGRIGVGAAAGPWHDGSVSLMCTTPGGRRLDCGHYKVGLAGSWREPALEASSASGGQVQLTGAWNTAAIDIRGLALPAAALGLFFPFAEQAQIGGEVNFSGRLADGGQTDLKVNWRGEIGEFPLGDQSLQIQRNGERGGYTLTWTPSASLPRLEGAISCDASGRCRGEMTVQVDEGNKAFNNLLAATGDKVGSGLYRYRIDAK